MKISLNEAREHHPLTSAKDVLIACVTWGTAFALIETAFITRANELLPLTFGHFWLTLLLAVGFTLLALLAASTTAILRQLLRKPSRVVVLLSGPWFLLLILAISYYRSFFTLTPRTPRGSLVTFIIVLVMLFALAFVQRQIQSAARVRLSVLISGVVLLSSGAAFLLSAKQPPLPVDGQSADLVQLGDTGLRVLLVGLDGATWSLIDPLIDKGELPTFTHLRQTAATANLETVVPTFSPPIWTSVATGQRAADHGIRDHTRTRLPLGLPDLPRLFKRTECLMKPTRWAVRLLAHRIEGRLLDNTPKDIRSPRLWSILSQHDLASVVLEWYVSHPAEVIDGVLVSDRFHRQQDAGPEMQRSVHPPEMAEALAPALVRPQDVPEELLFDLLDTRDLDDQGRAELRTVDPTFFRVIRDTIGRDYTVRNLLPLSLAKVPDWRLTAVFYKAVDNVHHRAWRYHNLPETDLESHPKRRFRTAINRYYQLCDRLLAETLEYADETTVVIVVSDHGWDPDYPGHDNAPDGIFIMAGGPTRRPENPGALHIYDVAPTVLALLGLPVAEDMEGRVARALVDPAFWDEHPIRSVKRYAIGRPTTEPALHPELDDDEIERLRALGYLD